MISNIDRYRLKLRIATELDAHRGGDVGVVVHSEEDEWWCCVETVAHVAEGFFEEVEDAVVTATTSRDDDDDYEDWLRRVVTIPTNAALRVPETGALLAPSGRYAAHEPESLRVTEDEVDDLTAEYEAVHGPIPSEATAAARRALGLDEEDLEPGELEAC